MHQALTIHNELESHYRDAMDYHAVDLLASHVVDDMLS